jgi:hypothetical protein
VTEEEEIYTGQRHGHDTKQLPPPALIPLNYAGNHGLQPAPLLTNMERLTTRDILPWDLQSSCQNQAEVLDAQEDEEVQVRGKQYSTLYF